MDDLTDIISLGIRIDTLKSEALRPLLADVFRAQKLLEHTSSQFHRRILIRAIFACIEGLLNDTRDVLFQKLATEPISPDSIHLLSILSGKDIVARNNGKTAIVERKLSTTTQLALILRIRGESHNLPVDDWFSQHEWGNTQKAFALRHRLTHPKIAGDADVTDDEVVLAMKAFYWILEHLSQMPSTT